MVSNVTNQNPSDADPMETNQMVLATEDGMANPWHLLEDGTAVGNAYTTDEDLVLVKAVEGSVRQALAEEFLGDAHSGYLYSADAEDGIYDAATEYVTESRCDVDVGHNAAETTRHDGQLAQEITDANCDKTADEEGKNEDEDVTMEAEDDTSDASKGGTTTVKMTESAMKTGAPIVKSPDVSNNVTPTAQISQETAGVTPATTPAQGPSVVRVPVHPVPPIPVQGPAFFPVGVPLLPHQLSHRHAKIAAAAAKAAVVALRSLHHENMAAAIPAVGIRMANSVRPPTPVAASHVSSVHAAGAPLLCKPAMAPASRMAPQPRARALGPATIAAQRVTGASLRPAAVIPAHGRVLPAARGLPRQVVPHPTLPGPVPAAALAGFNGISLTRAHDGNLAAIRHVKRPNYDACYSHPFKVRGYSP